MRGRIELTSAMNDRRAARLVVPGSLDQHLWFESKGHNLTNNSSDPFVLASLLLWMQTVDTVHVDGALSGRLLRNLDEFQAAWSLWKPDRYRPVSIVCDEVLPDEVEPDGSAIAAFSGGVDAAYTVMRHLEGRVRWGQPPVQAALLIHGFDIPLADADAFARATARAGRMLEETPVDVLTLRTNMTSLDIDWNDHFGIAVAAALTAHAPRYSVGLIGSSEPYDHLVLPWGSNPVTDPLASSGFMEVRHDGAGANRTEKVRELASWPDLLPHLRVCYLADSRDENCGRCEKCIRTMLNFRANDLPVPACFERIASDAEIRSLRLPPSGALFEEWSSLVDTARRRHVSDSWVMAAGAALRRAKRRARVAAVPGTRSAYHRLRRSSRPRRGE